MGAKEKWGALAQVGVKERYGEEVELGAIAFVSMLL